MITDSQEYNKEDCEEMVKFARDAAESYIIEKQRMDVGSVDRLFTRKAGVFMQVITDDANEKVRGTSAVYGSQMLADAIISSTIESVSEHSIGSMVSRTELSNVIFELAPISLVYLSDCPETDIKLGSDVPIITGEDDSWIYPTTPINQGWSVEEYLNKTSRKAGLEEDYWKDNRITVVRTKSFREDDVLSIPKTFEDISI